MVRVLHLDYETRSEIDLKTRGLDVYSSHPSTAVLMCSYAFGNGPVKLWKAEDGPPPQELVEALDDDECEKWAFNAQFERIMTWRVLARQFKLKFRKSYKRWRCTAVLAYMQSFYGTLDQVGEQMEAKYQKHEGGKRLINIFCKPQKPSKKNPLIWRDSWTDPDDWETFCRYCIGDTESEREIKNTLIKFPILESEWELYEIDQAINDRGVPIDMDFVRNAKRMSDLRREELLAVMKEKTGLANPNSPAQLLRWLKGEGYPFDDLRKDTVKKVLAENAAETGAEVQHADNPDLPESDDLDMFYEVRAGGFMSEVGAQVLQLRQQQARTSVKKYDAILARVGTDGIYRFGFQFAGASRTNRWSGRGFQLQNLSRPPKELSVSKEAMAAGVVEDFHLETVTNIIREGDYEALKLYVAEPMNALAGTVRSAIRAADDEELMASDLSSIETVVIGCVSGCERLINVFRNKLDPYKDFGADLYDIPYEEVVGKLRQDSKPAVLGCGFRLGGGDLFQGKKTGLWAYAESLGVNMTKSEAATAVKKYRDSYPEVPKLWYALEKAVKMAMQSPGRKVRPIIHMDDGRRIEVPVLFERMKPYMTIILPSGRRMYYFRPQMKQVTMPARTPGEEPWTKENFTYMGKRQNGAGWVRINSHGGKITENIVQAIARDILCVGLRRAWDEGFPIIGHVHDEIINLIKRGSNFFTKEWLIELMTNEIEWAKGWPLAAAGWQAQFYRKD